MAHPSFTAPKRLRCLFRSSGIRLRAAASSTVKLPTGSLLYDEQMSYLSGRHFLHIRGPTNVPERVLRALARPTIDHRGPEFSRLALELLEGVKEVFKTSGKVLIFPSSGSGAWEAAMVNTLSPGDSVLMFETGQFATLWQEMAGKLGLNVHFVPGDWRRGADPATVESMLS